MQATMSTTHATTQIPTTHAMPPAAAVRARVLNLPFREPGKGGGRIDGGFVDGGFDDGELVRLLAEKDGAQVSEHFFTHLGRPYLTCFVRWTEPRRAPVSTEAPRSGARSGPRTATRAPGNRSRSAARAEPASRAGGDPPELDPTSRRVHDSLRSWRAARARELGVPAYRVLTNRQLETLARSRPSDPGVLLGLEGIGPATARVHGEAIVARIREAAASGAA
jgi:hypothetical protein